MLGIVYARLWSIKLKIYRYWRKLGVERSFRFGIVNIKIFLIAILKLRIRIGISV